MNNCMKCKCEVCRESSGCTRTFLPEDMSVTMAYVPYQLDLSYYSPLDALSRGTLFSELDKPFKGRCAT